jgi:hypothetical protein
LYGVGNIAENRANGAVIRRAAVGVPDESLDDQLRGEDFMNELDRRIQALTPEDMLDGEGEVSTKTGRLTAALALPKLATNGRK